MARRAGPTTAFGRVGRQAYTKIYAEQLCNEIIVLYKYIYVVYHHRTKMAEAATSHTCRATYCFGCGNEVIGTYASRFRIGILQYHEVIIKTSLMSSGTFKNRVTSLLVAIERYQKGEQFCAVSVS